VKILGPVTGKVVCHQERRGSTVPSVVVLAKMEKDDRVQILFIFSAHFYEDAINYVRNKDVQHF